MPRARRWLPAVAAVVAILVFAGVKRPWKSAAAVVAAEAVRGAFSVETAARGELAAVHSIPIPAPPGWNNKVVFLIAEGTRVAPGDTLATFDASTQIQRVDEQRNAWEGAAAELQNRRATGAKALAEKEASLHRQELALEQSRLNAEALRFESASRKREAEIDLRRAELDLREADQSLASQRQINAADLAKAEAEVRKQQLELERAERDLAALTVTAPDSGMVVYRKIRAAGERRKIRLGDQVWQGQAIMELPDLTAFEVRTWVQEVDIHRLQQGQEAVVAIDALQGRELAGKVTRIAPLARVEGDDKLKVFDVDVLLAGDVAGLLPGMTAQCRIIHEKYDDVVHVPLEAVFRRDGRTVVYPASGGGPREVVLGAAGDDDVIVTAGLQAGEDVLLVPPADDGDRAAGKPAT